MKITSVLLYLCPCLSLLSHGRLRLPGEQVGWSESLPWELPHSSGSPPQMFLLNYFRAEGWELAVEH